MKSRLRNGLVRQSIILSMLSITSFVIGFRELKEPASEYWIAYFIVCGIGVCAMLFTALIAFRLATKAPKDYELRVTPTQARDGFTLRMWDAVVNKWMFIGWGLKATFDHEMIEMNRSFVFPTKEAAKEVAARYRKQVLEKR